MRLTATEKMLRKLRKQLNVSDTELLLLLVRQGKLGRKAPVSVPLPQCESCLRTLNPAQVRRGSGRCARCDKTVATALQDKGLLYRLNGSAIFCTMCRERQATVRSFRLGKKWCDKCGSALKDTRNMKPA